jgi:hypothetical protein
MEKNSTLSTGSSSPLPLWLRYIICYVAWFGVTAAGLWIMLQLRINLLDISLAVNVNPWAMAAVDKFGILLLGLVWLVAVFAAEAYLRQGVERNQLWRRIGRVAGIAAILLGVSYGLQWLMRAVA